MSQGASIAIAVDRYLLRPRRWPPTTLRRWQSR